ncbi:hypothetical protein Afil01_42940 [Actinorhabdospora filicis]|uniref:YtxH domain-containing protein n=1 Tax=Actinorhabdospora filicis TaxID=1785913 RepID=A0A9W6SPG7_9ACTN|nr:hypothetical protein [Actinorhabdospora filicis]GLZ79487.1 hypothetical protein Afil01_42940 [Actinorhabdospora filicis]
MRKVAFAAGLAIGYVLGAKAGRERYEQILRGFKRFRDNPTVQSTAGLVRGQATRLADKGKDAFARTKVGAAVMGAQDEHGGF